MHNLKTVDKMIPRVKSTATVLGEGLFSKMNANIKLGICLLFLSGWCVASDTPKSHCQLLLRSFDRPSAIDPSHQVDLETVQFSPAGWVVYYNDQRGVPFKVNLKRKKLSSTGPVPIKPQARQSEVVIDGSRYFAEGMSLYKQPVSLAKTFDVYDAPDWNLTIDSFQFTEGNDKIFITLSDHSIVVLDPHTDLHVRFEPSWSFKTDQEPLETITKVKSSANGLNTLVLYKNGHSVFDSYRGKVLHGYFYPEKKEILFGIKETQNRQVTAIPSQVYKTNRDNFLAIKKFRNNGDQQYLIVTEIITGDAVRIIPIGPHPFEFQWNENGNRLTWIDEEGNAGILSIRRHL